MQLLPVIYANDGIKTPEHCRDCGGVCCQRYPGIAWPSDFGPRETLAMTIASYLETSRWSVDSWEGDPREEALGFQHDQLHRVYYVRPATVEGRGKVRDDSWGGPCIHWISDHGCSLAFFNRPYECRHLAGAPFVNGERKCEYDNGIGKRQSVMEWIPFQDEVIAAMEFVEAKHAANINT